MPFLHCISSFEGASYKNLKYSYSHWMFCFFLFSLAFTSANIIFQKFLELHSTIFEKKKDFHHKFSISNRLTQTPHPLLKVTVMQISKFKYLYVRVHSYKNNTLNISHSYYWEFFSHEVCKFVKKHIARLMFNIVIFLNDWKQTFHISHVRISQKVKEILKRNLRLFS